ncbi:hypothetical protein D1007_58873 [Hordeum vulgare]|nr:hypothetical protein D1007_58873 [Hordeum vulgare]
MDLANLFLVAGYRVPPGSPMIFCVKEVRANDLVIVLIACFTSRFDTYFLLGKVFWCGCKFITFASNNILTNFDNIFLITGGMHTLSYNTEDEE